MGFKLVLTIPIVVLWGGGRGWALLTTHYNWNMYVVNKAHTKCSKHVCNNYGTMPHSSPLMM